MQRTNSLSMNYDNARGNIIEKTGVGKYTYHNQKIHAVTKVTNPDNIISPNTQDIEYTIYNQPEKIIENDKELTYYYGPDHERKLMLTKQISTNQTVAMRMYIGDMEVTGDNFTNLKYVHYINSPAGLAAIVTEENNVRIPYTIYTDHLGSIVKATFANGNVVAEQNFDAWGKKRNPTDWTYNNIPSTPWWLYRGYTGHEHLDEFDLINMNGRMYDPLLGRMLSADNYVADNTSTQAYNRYTYANNNPVKFVDPDGELTFLAVVAIVAAVSGGINVATNWKDIKSQGGGWSSFGRAAAYFGIGAGIGAISTIGGAALTPVLGTGFVSGATIGGFAGFTSNFSNTLLSTGGDWREAGINGRRGLLAGAALGGLTAGTISAIKGNNFWTGAKLHSGQSVFSFKKGLHSNPSFKFKDAYSLKSKSFWKYGHTNTQDVMYMQNGKGELIETPSQLDYLNGESANNTFKKYSITGNTIENGDGTFTTTINKKPYQSFNLIASDNPSYMSHTVSRNSISITTFQRPTNFILGGTIPRSFGTGFYSIFQTR